MLGGARTSLWVGCWEAWSQALIHPSAWKANSANFVLAEFSEVRMLPSNLVINSGRGLKTPTEDDG